MAASHTPQPRGQCHLESSLNVKGLGGAAVGAPQLAESYNGTLPKHEQPLARGRLLPLADRRITEIKTRRGLAAPIRFPSSHAEVVAKLSQLRRSSSDAGSSREGRAWAAMIFPRKSSRCVQYQRSILVPCRESHRIAMLARWRRKAPDGQSSQS
jgi:hypothetical protein